MEYGDNFEGPQWPPNLWQGPTKSRSTTGTASRNEASASSPPTPPRRARVGSTGSSGPPAPPSTYYKRSSTHAAIPSVRWSSRKYSARKYILTKMKKEGWSCPSWAGSSVWWRGWGLVAARENGVGDVDIGLSICVEELEKYRQDSWVGYCKGTGPDYNRVPLFLY